MIPKNAGLICKCAGGAIFKTAVRATRRVKPNVSRSAYGSGVGVLVGVNVGVGVCVAVGVNVAVGVLVGVRVGVNVAVGIGDATARTAISVGAIAAIAIGDIVGVGSVCKEQAVKPRTNRTAIFFMRKCGTRDAD